MLRSVNCSTGHLGKGHLSTTTTFFVPADKNPYIDSCLKPLYNGHFFYNSHFLFVPKVAIVAKRFNCSSNITV